MVHLAILQAVPRKEGGDQTTTIYIYSALEHIFKLQTKAVFVTVPELVHETTTVVVGRVCMKNKIKDENEKGSDKERRKKKTCENRTEKV